MNVSPFGSMLLWIFTGFATAALAVWGASPRGRARPIRLRVLVRALLPGRILRSPSGRLDIASFLFSRFFAGTVLGWALFSSNGWAAMTGEIVAGMPALPGPIPPSLAAVMMTVALFLSYEAAYWLNHWLCHRVPCLWAFHKVHHTADSLSLLTNFRVHPVDTIIFYNMAAALNGITAGFMQHLLGPGAAAISVSGTNILVFLTSISLSYLQHSHLWLATTGRWGRWILSPAHHQLHHSTDPRHFNRNLGSTIGLFDRLAGTLLVPSAKRQPLRFGVDGLSHEPHTLQGAVVQPFVEAAYHLAAFVPATFLRRPDVGRGVSASGS